MLQFSPQCLLTFSVTELNLLLLQEANNDLDSVLLDHSIEDSFNVSFPYHFNSIFPDYKWGKKNHALN